MGSFLGELRVAVRTLLKSRGFTGAVLATLTLALALETAVVAVVNAYLVRALPYPGADRLYNVVYSRPGEAYLEGLADLNWREVSDVVEHPISWDLDMFYLIGGDHPEAAAGAWVTPGFMRGLGIVPAFGRSFAPEEFAVGGPQVALISHALWRRRFGADSAILGRRFEAYVSDRPRDPDIFTIVGVLPERFWHVNPYTEVLTPLRAASHPYLVSLRQGVPPAVAEDRITQLLRGGLASFPAGRRIELRPARDAYTREMKPTLVAIGAAVTLVLLIACANVAFLALIRGMRRQKEVAVRLALGASRMQVARMLITESLLLCGAAAVAGLLVAALLLRQLAPSIQEQLGRRVPGGESAMSIDLTVVAAVGALTVLIALAVTLAPLVVAGRSGLFSTLRSARQTGAEGARGRRTRFSLVAAELAGAVALLTGCALMVRTVVRLLDVDLGIRPAHVVEATLTLRERSYPDAQSRVTFYERLLGGLRQIPGVTSVALASPTPLAQYRPQPVRAADAGTGATVPATIRAVTAEYFSTLGISLVGGRVLAESDRAGGEPVIVLSETAARRLWPDGAALGRSVHVVEDAISGDTMTVTRTVVGVVRDVRQAPTDEDLTEVYLPLRQSPRRFVVTVARTAAAPAPWLAQLRRELARIDPQIVVSGARELEEMVDAQLARPRFLASLFAGFGLFAALLALMGIYGVIAYAVKQREHEVAIRIAVGADARAIMSLFLRDGLRVSVVGIAIGVLGAVGIGRLLEAQLFGVRSADPATLVTVSLLLGASSIAAIWWPARRASATDPAIALREE